MDNISSNNKWPVAQKRFVAFLDILGFKDMVGRTSQKELYDKLYTLIDAKTTLTTAFQKKVDIGEFRDLFHIVSFSDSIIIFSKDDSVTDFRRFLLIVQFIFSKACAALIPMKGAIAYGEITIDKDNDLYFGQPLIDAYLLEEDVNHLGVVFHNTVDSYVSQNSEETSEDKVSRFYYEDKQFMKSGLINHTALVWFPFVIKKKPTNEEFLIHLKKFYSTVSGSPRRYIDNTIETVDRGFKNGNIPTRLDKYKW